MASICPPLTITMSGPSRRLTRLLHSRSVRRKLRSLVRNPLQDLKLALGSKFASALVTHCHMGQAEAENMFDTIYKNATAEEEN
jgi:hypothetical protein